MRSNPHGEKYRGDSNGLPARDRWILADYRCGCTWVGPRAECIEYCGKHGENRRQMIPIKRENAERDGIIGWDWQQPDALRVLAAEFAESSTRAHTVANIHNPASDSGKLEIAIARAEARTWAAAQAAVNRVLLAPTEAVRSDAEDAAKWREHAEVMRLSGLDDALLIRLVMRENGTVWSNVHVIDVGRFGRKTILGLKAIGLCAEAQAEKLFNAMERTDMNGESPK